jgi:hypothetical protein
MTTLWITRIASTAAVLGALASLTTPLALQEVDRTGRPIPCGTALGASHTHSLAAHEDDINRQLHDSLGPPYQISDYVHQCDALVWAKRTRAGWVGVAGGILMMTTFLGQFGALAATALPYRKIPRIQTP